MNYYQFHIGDYRRDTSHLSLLEHGVYRQLLDQYYMTEQPIASGDAKVMRSLCVRNADEMQALANVLEDFFTKTDQGYIHKRCDIDIAAFHGKSVSAREAANARWAAARAIVNANAMRTHSECNADGMHEACTSDANGMLTINHKPLTNNQSIHMSPDKLPTCPTQEVIDLYNATLPELPSVKVLNDKRKRDTKKFWRFVLTSEKRDGTPRASTAEQAMEWIGAYFNRARDNDFVMGRIKKSDEHSSWQCDYDYLISEKGNTQVIEKTKESAQ